MPRPVSTLCGVLTRMRKSRLAAWLQLPRQFDPTNDDHLNAVAGQLLRCFRERDDVEAYSFLVELLHPRLLRSAQGIARRHAVFVDPEDLVSGFMARLFTDVRKDQPVVHQFLAMAYTTMRFDALNQLRLNQRNRARGAVWEQLREPGRLPIDPAWALDHRERCVEALHLAGLFLSVVHHCFHRLPERDRRALALQEVEGLSYDLVAPALGIPRNQVGMVIKRARSRLARDIETALRIHIRPPGPPVVPASCSS